MVVYNFQVFIFILLHYNCKDLAFLTGSPLERWKNFVDGQGKVMYTYSFTRVCVFDLRHCGNGLVSGELPVPSKSMSAQHFKLNGDDDCNVDH